MGSHADRHTDGQLCRNMIRHTHGQTCGYVNRHTDGQTCREKHAHGDVRIDASWDGEMDRDCQCKQLGEFQIIISLVLTKG